MQALAASRGVLVQRFCSAEPVPADDPLWFELQSVQGHLTAQPRALLEFLQPASVQLASHTASTRNFGALIAHVADQLRADAGKGSQAACNAAALLTACTAHVLAQVQPPDLQGAFAAPSCVYASQDALGQLVAACFATIQAPGAAEHAYALLVQVLALCITLCSAQVHHPEATAAGVCVCVSPLMNSTGCALNIPHKP